MSISPRARREAIQEHLAPLRARAAEREAQSLQDIIDRFAVPSGYRRSLFTDCQMPMVCERCGANVSDSAAGEHTAWHQRLWERLGGEV